MKDIEKIEKILEAVNAVTFTDGEKSTVQLGGDEWFLSSVSFDLNAIRELELLVIEKFGMHQYGSILYDAIADPHQTLTTVDCAFIATADAATRIAAMLAVIKEGK